jgi:hypothetical protein
MCVRKQAVNHLCVIVFVNLLETAVVIPVVIAVVLPSRSMERKRQAWTLFMIVPRYVISYSLVVYITARQNAIKENASLV